MMNPWVILRQDRQGTAQPEEALSRERNLHQEAPSRERNLEKDGGRIIDHHQEAQVQESIFHQRKLDLMKKEKQEPYLEAEDHVQEEAAALWVPEDQLEGT